MPKVKQPNAVTRLSDYTINPANPSKATEAEIERLAGKIERNPIGLRAMRLAYVTDMPEVGKRVIISGNKRLRVLRRLFGEDAEVSADWFVDVTEMSEKQRREFIVSANLSDGQWDWEILLRDYKTAELADLGFSEDLLESVSGSMLDDLETLGEELGEREKTEGKNAGIMIHLPPEMMPVCRSYNRTHGTSEIVDFIIGKLKAFDAGKETDK